MKNLIFTILTIHFIAINVYSQNTITVGKGSYAEYPPTSVANFSSYNYSYNELKNNYPFYLHESVIGQPVPTNDWWTDAIFSQYAGDMWAYPHGVSADNEGVNIVFSDGFEKGKMTKSNFLEVKGSTDNKSINFSPHSAKPFNWGDLNMSFRCEDNNKNFLDVTISHGSPFIWIETKGIQTVLKPSKESQLYDSDGNQVNDFPIEMNVFSIKIENQFYGVHAPDGTSVNLIDGNYFLNTPDEKKYVVISTLPEMNFLNTYDKFARNKLINTIFEYDYDITKGQISTTFIAETKNLDNNNKGGATIMAFLPHHYRTSKKSFDFIKDANYFIHKGKMRTAIGTDFTFNYAFTGLPPHLGAPKNMTAQQTKRLNKMVSDFQISKFNINTYNKTLDELSEMMLIASQINHPGFEDFKNSLKRDLIQWLTYDKTTEGKGKGFFFSQYSQYGALIGFPSGFDSQAFNDLHFHYGYYVLSAARLMMVDEDFKNGYSDMVKLIAKSYANWERWDGINEKEKFPFLRTFDPYVGHSWASGVSDEQGSNQESTSEAVMSWFGLFNLGLALNDSNLIALGAMGYKLETEATLEYWFDIHEENFPSSYKKKYVGILRSGELIDSTWFSKDPAWTMGIQFVPNAHYCSYLSPKPTIALNALKSLMQDRIDLGIIETPDIYTNIANMGWNLGSYLLGFYATWDPKAALQLQDKLYEKEKGKWQFGSQAVINYYLSNANITFGKPAKDYHTSLPAGAVYENGDGKITYLIYNHKKKDMSVNIYKNGKITDTVIVKAGEFYIKQPRI